MKLAATIKVKVESQYSDEHKIEEKEIFISETDERTQLVVDCLSYGQKIVLDAEALAEVMNTLKMFNDRIIPE